MQANYVLTPLTPVEQASPSDLTELHCTLLPDSPIVLLGRRFMESFYYKTLVQEGVLCGAVAYVDGVPAGFIVGTVEAAGFMRRALRRHPLRLAWLFGVSVLGDPRRLAALWESWQIMRGQPETPVGADNVAEILSFGVLPTYRSPKFVRQSGLRISLDLLQLMLQQLYACRARRVRVVVDEDNLEARLFYQGQGWELGNERVAGWRKPVVEYVRRESAGAPLQAP